MRGLVAAMAAFLAATASRGLAQQTRPPAEFHVIPYPREVRALEKPVLLPPEVRMVIVGTDAVPPGANVLAEELRTQFSVTATPELTETIGSGRPPARAITLLLCTDRRGPGWIQANAWGIAPPRAGQPESYAIKADENAVVIATRNDPGFVYAALTLLQLMEPHSDRAERPDGVQVPGIVVRDWPALRRRGIMLDPARLKERNEYYAAVVDFAARRKANALFLHLTDDNAIALQFASHPTLAGEHAFTAGDIKGLVAQGQRLGMEIIPEIESLGHAGAITGDPRYRGLSEGRSNCLNPCLPATLSLLDGLYGDCAALFPSEFVHCGLDEVGALGRSPECQRAYAEDPDKGDVPIEDWAYARHVAALHDLLARRGKRMVMWGDMLLRHRDAVTRIPKDVIIDDWHYGTAVDPSSAEFFTAAGFEVIGSPALVCGGYRVMPSTANLENVKQFARIAQRGGLVGLNVTVWVPQRYIADAAWLSFAEAAAIMWEGLPDSEGSFDEERFLRAYVYQRFGIEPDTDLIGALRSLQQIVPGDAQFRALMPPRPEDLRKLMQEEELPAATEGTARLLHDETPRIVETLEARRPRVMRNVEEFDALLLVARIERQLGAMLDLAVNKIAFPLGDEERATLERIASDNQTLLQALDASWDRWRYEDVPGRVGLPTSLQGHWLRQYFVDFGDALRSVLATPGA